MGSLQLICPNTWLLTWLVPCILRDNACEEQKQIQLVVCTRNGRRRINQQEKRNVNGFNNYCPYFLLPPCPMPTPFLLSNLQELLCTKPWE